jgi:hypothetical protein
MVRTTHQSLLILFKRGKLDLNVLISLGVVLFAVLALSACSASPAAGVDHTDIMATATITRLPETPTIGFTATVAPTPTLTATPRICSPLDIYVGKDTARQPELISQPVAPVGSVKQLVDSGVYDWLPSSYINVMLGGKTTLGNDIIATEETLLQLARLFEDAMKEQYFPTVVSGYRSIDDQGDLSSLYGEGPGVYYAEPGRSEHQLGVAIDLGWAGSLLDFYTIMNDESAKDFYRWLKSSAHLYGFVLSYPYKERDGKFNLYEPFITEYKAETWHIRYIGVDLATKIYEAGYLDPASNVVPQAFYCP